MSGDVQPRKRKDKRKRRDDRKSEGDVTILRQSSFQDDDDSSSHGVHITKMGNDDVHLHVQHQHGTGGHWCAKIIFFSLMAVLLGLVGLIIMENRGIEDLDTPLSESRYSNYFDGWVEEHRAEEHDEHDEHLSHEAALDEHDDEHDDEVEEPYEQHSGEEEETEQEHDEDANDEDDEEEEENTAAENVTAEDDEEKDEDDDIAESADRTQYLADDAEEEEEEADEEEEEEDADGDIEESIEPIASKSRAQSAPETVEEDDDNIEEEEEEEDEEEEQAESVEPTISKSQAADDDDEQDNDEDAAEEEDEKLEESAEPAAQSVPDDDDDDEFEQADNDEDEFESLDQDVDTQAEQLKAKEAKDQAAEENIEAVTTTSWLGSLAVKFGVGIALALVSRLVLIRNNPNTIKALLKLLNNMRQSDEQQPTPEIQMRRRLTIATAEDHIPDDDTEELPPLDDEAYSEEEIEIEEEIEVETSDIEECDDNVALTARYVPETFEQLSAMFRPKTESQPSEKESEKEPEPQPKPEVEAEREPETEPEAEGTAASDIYVEYEDGDIEDYEHDDSEDDDELISDEEEDEISDVDDADLMSRLEAKYGRLPAKEYESNPDSDDPSWTQIKPKEPTGAKFVEDELFEQELRRAQAEMINENHANALRAFNTLTHTYAHKPLAHLRRAQALERIAELRRSNQLLMDAIESYKRYLAFDESITNIDYRTAGERCIEHMRFLDTAGGCHTRAAHRALSG
ncbi:probable serine/threonine-protein kinase kinX isoform X7 [Drosophila mojavensis]|uniref:probable serine/threonine-protein kinase kinX isoform X7 n=1 Tax=Drosophila mojavensis TaxID=7230 RepID=UPI0013EE588F|nr:probable serine/threonine-protein kinase kinX isoform X7 [Drosophila mojavensis]